MKMTPLVLVLGGLLVFWASISIMVIMPAATMHPEPSDIWRPLTEKEKAGFDLFVQNGCTYCHSQYIRVIDWGHGAFRIAQAGDYEGKSPSLLGTERTGPDLSQEGGIHPDDWHVAHFTNPRFTSPLSLMPNWEFLGEKKIDLLVAYVQSEGLKNADFRVARQQLWNERAVAAYHSGTDKNIEWVHSNVPEGWRALPNPYPATDDALLRGKAMYQQFCMGCHGPIGDGQGPAARFLQPVPLNFTALRRNLIEDRYIGGILYYQIMNGISGTAMPFFKKHLESEKIWDVSNYIAVNFIGYTDANIAPKGIDAPFESDWKNPYQIPLEQLRTIQRQDSEHNLSE